MSIFSDIYLFLFLFRNKNYQNKYPHGRMQAMVLGPLGKAKVGNQARNAESKFACPPSMPW